MVQDAENGDVLMMAWMNRESVALTMEEGRTVYLEPFPAGALAQG